MRFWNVTLFCYALYVMLGAMVYSNAIPVPPPIQQFLSTTTWTGVAYILGLISPGVAAALSATAIFGDFGLGITMITAFTMSVLVVPGALMAALGFPLVATAIVTSMVEFVYAVGVIQFISNRYVEK